MTHAASSPRRRFATDRTILCVALPLLFLLTPASTQELAPDRLYFLSICIGQVGASVSIKGENLHFFEEESELLLHQVEGQAQVTIQAGPGGLRIGGKDLNVEGVRVRSTLNWISYQNRIWREDLIVRKSGGGLQMVNELSLESYLYGLINAEVLSAWPLESKKAQAVAARTYAVHRKLNLPRKGCDMTATEYDQMYGGFNSEDAQARQAVDQTRGQILVFDNRPAKAYFHSTCGGRTASSASVWKDPLPYLISHECPYCHGSPRFAWEYAVPQSALLSAFGFPASRLKDFSFDIVGRDESGRVTQVRGIAGGQKILLTGEQLRGKLGYRNLKSTAFTFQSGGRQVVFKGRGLGHGVGLCQYGAAKMAESGFSFSQILDFYYPGTEIRRLY